MLKKMVVVHNLPLYAPKRILKRVIWSWGTRTESLGQISLAAAGLAFASVKVQPSGKGYTEEVFCQPLPKQGVKIGVSLIGTFHFPPVKDLELNLVQVDRVQLTGEVINLPDLYRTQFRQLFDRLVEEAAVECVHIARSVPLSRTTRCVVFA